LYDPDGGANYRFVDGTPYIDDGSRTGGFNGPPWNTSGVIRNDVQVTISGITVD
jgi:hypothetical protein